MPFQLSPGVNVTEIDLTTVIPAVATTDAAIGGVFQWGPVDKPSLVTSEAELAKVYGKPHGDNFETWMTAASFLAYSNKLHVSRAHHSFGSDLILSVYAIQGADYLVVAGNASTGVTTGDVTAASASLDESVVTVDASTITDTISTQSSAVNTGTDTIDVSLTNIKEGEQVTASSTVSLPTALGDGSGPFFVINSDENGFQLSTTQGGAAIVLGDTGTGDMTLERAGSTRITLTGKTWTGSNGSASVEFHDAAYSFNAVANTSTMSGVLANHIVKNEDSYDDAVASFDDNVNWIAKYPGALGNSLKISVCDSAAAYQSDVTIAAGQVTTFSVGVGANTGTVTSPSDVDVDAVTAQINVGDKLKVGNTTIGTQFLEVTAVGATSGGSATLNFAAPLTTTEDISVASGVATAAAVQRNWEHFDLVEVAPGQSGYVAAQGNTAAQDELHVVVIDENGMISGIPGTVLEVFDGLSRATNAKGEQGDNIYYKDVINSKSEYVWWANDASGAASATALTVASSTNTDPISLTFGRGRNLGTESACELGDVLRAYDVFRSAEDIDISLVLTGKSRGASNGAQLANYLVDNIAERRKDCVVFISPEKADVVDNVTDISEDVVEFRNSCRSTSYAVLDSGYKYQYDKYNDQYRWVPLNGDIAGLAAYTDSIRDAWWSPAGFNRGQIKNIVKLAWNPKKGERDILYKNGVNPIVNFPGQGIVMFGDKTLLAKPSAFDRINVRRLFIVLEKAIATAAKFTLFEFNDEFTRASFVNLVTPFLRDVQGRRGVTDFVVVCDETNNTGEVVDRNEFVGDIYIKPARSINFIQLNFVAVRSGVEFSEVIGNF